MLIDSAILSYYLIFICKPKLYKQLEVSIKSTIDPIVKSEFDNIGTLHDFVPIIFF